MYLLLIYMHYLSITIYVPFSSLPLFSPIFLSYSLIYWLVPPVPFYPSFIMWIYSLCLDKFLVWFWFVYSVVRWTVNVSQYNFAISVVFHWIHWLSILQTQLLKQLHITLNTGTVWADFGASFDLPLFSTVLRYATAAIAIVEASENTYLSEQ